MYSSIFWGRKKRNLTRFGLMIKNHNFYSILVLKRINKVSKDTQTSARVTQHYSCYNDLLIAIFLAPHPHLAIKLCVHFAVNTRFLSQTTRVMRRDTCPGGGRVHVPLYILLLVNHLLVVFSVQKALPKGKNIWSMSYKQVTLTCFGLILFGDTGMFIFLRICFSLSYYFLFYAFWFLCEYLRVFTSKSKSGSVRFYV